MPTVYSNSRHPKFVKWSSVVAFAISVACIEEQKDTITDSRNRKYPLKISGLATITYKEKRKGKFRSLLLHDNGVRYMDIHTSKYNADRIVEHLLNVNPSVKVKHANYL